MGLSFSHLLVLVLVGVLLFGRGRISDLMGDVAKGIKSFKKGLSDDEADTPISNKPSEAKKIPPQIMTDITPESISDNHSNLHDKNSKS
jgi:sec-independent protein translocase protein TatA